MLLRFRLRINSVLVGASQLVATGREAEAQHAGTQYTAHAALLAGLPTAHDAIHPTPQQLVTQPLQQLHTQLPN